MVKVLHSVAASKMYLIHYGTTVLLEKYQIFIEDPTMCQAL